MENNEKKEMDNSLDAMRKFTGDQNLQVIGIDESFGFKCQQCGKCCMNREDIILNPFDIYNGAKYLGITTEEFLMKYTHFDLGGYSKIPMVLLRTTENGFCPLLKFDVKDGCKFKCMIHPAKPGACANHPIGVAYATNKTTGDTSTTYIKVEQCPNSVSDEMHTVRDWVKPYLDHQDEIDAAHKIQSSVMDYFDPRELFIILRIMTGLADKASVAPAKEFARTAQHLMTQFAATVVQVAYGCYDINRPFVEQVEENQEELDKFYTHTKSLFDALKAGFHSIAGMPFDEALKKYNEREGRLS